MQPIEQILVVGAGPLGRLTERGITDRSKRRAVMAHASLRDEPIDPRLARPVIGDVTGFEDLLSRHVVDEVYFAPGGPQDVPDVQRCIWVCERLGVPFALPACGGYRLVRAEISGGGVTPDGFVHYLGVRKKPWQRALKRLLDLVFATALLLLLSPLLVLVAVAIAWSSPGPILFAQERVGMRGRGFRMLKFRSMVADAEARKAALLPLNDRTGPAFKLACDPRVTRLGRWLRKYSIDEIPQLLNVVRGEMSLVGPRPALPDEVARYAAWQRRRLSVRPGLTCIWQISGRNEISFGSWMVMDMRYIDHWSLAEDLRILARTLPVVVTGRGAT